MGFADTGKLGVAVRPRVYSDRLPKNVAQPGLEGKKLFQIGGVNPTIFNLDAALHANALKLESHSAGLGVPLETIWFDWALMLFAKPFPVHLAAVVWDAMFLEQDEGDRLRRL